VSLFLYNELAHNTPMMAHVQPSSITIPLQIVQPFSVSDSLKDPYTMAALDLPAADQDALKKAQLTINQIRAKIYNPEKTQWLYKAMITTPLPAAPVFLAQR
jgi:hypothetical protein